MFNTISLIGVGYIGLPTGTLLASRKKKVIGVDINISMPSIPSTRAKCTSSSLS
jgi:UDP-N-acetyl-D-mannosaminuronate dehydrogenase